MIDIETSNEMAARARAESMAKLSMERIPHYLREGRTLGPLSVLFVLLIYFLLSPLLPSTLHEYIYHILH